MILECLGVLLRLLQNRLHNRVIHNFLRKVGTQTQKADESQASTHRNFRIAHGPCKSFLLRFVAALCKESLLTPKFLLLDFFRMLFLRIMLSRFLDRLDGLGIVPHREQYV